MFRQRLLTSLVLIPLVLLSIYFANAYVLSFLVLLLVVVMGWEWLQLIPLTQLPYKIFFLTLLLLATFGSIYWLQYWLVAGLIVWGIILFCVITFPTSQTVWGYPVVVGGMGLLLLPLFASTSIGIYQSPHGQDLLIYLLFLVWMSDTGAYLVGKLWGRRKLIPNVSPGKTVEGALGGFWLTMLFALFGYFYFQPTHIAVWFILAIGIALIALLGDLFISMLKRRTKLKDTGQLLPGHGGILDRLDSLIAALPLFYGGLYFLAPGI